MKYLQALGFMLLLLLWIFPIPVAMIDFVWYFFTDHSLIMKWEWTKIVVSFAWVFFWGFFFAGVF